MITLLIGENSFEVNREVARRTDAFSGIAEKVDGTEVELNRLADLFMGGSLFSSERLIIIRNLSTNTAVWNVLPEWLERASGDIDLVLVEEKPDKRTKTYKALQKIATAMQFDVWKDWDRHKAEAWVAEEAKQRNITLDRASTRHLVERAGVDQWRLHHALEKLAVLPEVTEQVIDAVVTLHPSENVFLLLETALRGDTTRLAAILRTLEQTEDAHKVFGLLAGQIFQLAALATAQDSYKVVSKDLGMKQSYALEKLDPIAKKLSQVQVRRLVNVFADADKNLKQSAADPWVLIENALFAAAHINK